jgi:chromosome segregation ATPase
MNNTDATLEQAINQIAEQETKITVAIETITPIIERLKALEAAVERVQSPAMRHLQGALQVHQKEFEKWRALRSLTAQIEQVRKEILALEADLMNPAKPSKI